MVSWGKASRLSGRAPVNISFGDGNKGCLSRGFPLLSIAPGALIDFVAEATAEALPSAG